MGSTGQRPEAEEFPCWLGGEVNRALTTEEAKLRTMLLRIDLDDPVHDAMVRIGHGDYRLLGVAGGLGGIDFGVDRALTCELGWRFVEGSGDVWERPSHTELMQSFHEYAKVYNSTIADAYLNGQIAPNKSLEQPGHE